MIKLSETMFGMFIAALLLCGFPKTTASEEQRPPPLAPIEQFDSFKSKVDQTFDRIESVIDQSRGPPEVAEKIKSAISSVEVAALNFIDHITGRKLVVFGQCKMNWINHPAAHEDEPSGTLTSGDYLAACMMSQGYQRRVACSVTLDSESCYDPIYAPVVRLPRSRL
jgi:hypothetical protein